MSLIKNLQKTLKTEGPITYGMLHDNYMNTNVPSLIVSNIYQYLSCAHLDRDMVLSVDDIDAAFTKGSAILMYADTQLAQEHPTDKRFLLRYLEQICLRLGTSNQVAPGYGHDIMYSRKPIVETYPKFDNSLYIPPSMGYWAIIARKARD